MELKNKKILITAGPTWVRIDRVRAITNIATGQTGMLLAKELVKLSCMVTLLLGPVSENRLEINRIVIKRFIFFEELKKILINELKNKYYDIVIHSAAVSDYKPIRTFDYKIDSHKKKWSITLVPTEKIIKEIKEISPHTFLVGFKLESFFNKNKLMKSAYLLIENYKADLVVANSFDKNKYIAYIIDKNNTEGPFRNKTEMVQELIRYLKNKNLD